MSKKVKLEQEYPEVYAFAEELVKRVRRDMVKRVSLTKTATELIQPLLDFKTK